MTFRGNYKYEKPYIEAPADKAVTARKEAYRQYHRLVKQEMVEMVRRHGETGVKLKKFAASLSHFGIGSEERLVFFVRGQCRSWLRDAPMEIREAALRLVGARCARINLKTVGVPFDDPLMGEPDDAFRQCRRELLP